MKGKGLAVWMRESVNVKRLQGRHRDDSIALGVPQGLEGESCVRGRRKPEGGGAGKQTWIIENWAGIRSKR